MKLDCNKCELEAFDNMCNDCKKVFLFYRIRLIGYYIALILSLLMGLSIYNPIAFYKYFGIGLLLVLFGYFVDLYNKKINDKWDISCGYVNDDLH